MGNVKPCRHTGSRSEHVRDTQYIMWPTLDSVHANSLPASSMLDWQVHISSRADVSGGVPAG